MRVRVCGIGDSTIIRLSCQAAGWERVRVHGNCVKHDDCFAGLVVRVCRSVPLSLPYVRCGGDGGGDGQRGRETDGNIRW